MTGWAQWRLYVAPAYLLLAIILGGSGQQAPIGNATLQLIGVGILLWAFLTPQRAMIPPKERRLNFLVAGAIAIVLLQLVPLPPALWKLSPFQAQFAAQDALLGIDSDGWRAWSLRPYATLDTGLRLIPPLAMLAAILKLEVTRQRYIAAALFAGVLLSILLGLLQVGSAGGAEGRFYPYPQSNFGVATGFFSNANHMATLLLCVIPFACATASALIEREPGFRAEAAIYAGLGGGILLLLVGLMMNGSLFGYLLVLPVLVSSLLMLSKSGQKLVKPSLLAFALLGGLAMIGFASGKIDGSRAAASTSASVGERQTILANSVDLIEKAGPLGTGLGSYDRVYRMEEPREEVSPFVVNAAHNDYLQWVIEAGWLGALFMLVALIWWFVALFQMRTSSVADQYAWAGGIASGVILLHSAVDYPLRTASLAVLFAACLALLLQSKRHLQEEKDLRPTRHVVID